MGLRRAKVIESGTFRSPALGVDSPYELIEDSGREDGLAVRCTESKETYGTDVLSHPTIGQIDDQFRAFVREVCAWLIANNPSPVREEASVAEIRRATSLDYTAVDLANDVEWIKTFDLTGRMHFLAGNMPDEKRRLELLHVAANVAASSGLSESDAKFVEVLGTGLGFDGDTVMNIVVSAMNGSLAA